MAEINPAQSAVAGRTTGRLVALAAAVVTGALTAAAVVLWVRHGTAVFVDTIMAGIAACL